MDGSTEKDTFSLFDINNINPSYRSQASEHNINDWLLCNLTLQAFALMDSFSDLAEI